MREQFEVYKKSEIVTHYSEAGEFSIPGITSFHQNRCPFVIPQSMQSCVDEILSLNFHYMRGVSKYLRYNKTTKEKLNEHKTYPFMQYLHDTTHTIVDATMCTKVSHLHLAWGIGSSRQVPELNQWKSAEGNCDVCGVKNLKLDECTDLSENDNEIEILEWIESERQGTKKWNTKYST